MMTAQRDYGVRVVVAYSNMTVGRVIFPFGMERQELVRKGLVVPVKPEEEAEAKPAAKAVPPRPTLTVRK